MNFSNLLSNVTLASFSPNCLSLALVSGTQLIIRDARDLKEKNKFTFIDKITTVEWSNDSNLILVGIFKGNYCEVKSMENISWECRLTESYLTQMTRIKFTPDSGKLISLCSFNLKISIWDLTEGSIKFINNPKFTNKNYAIFSKCQKYCCVGERRGLKDYIGIYKISNFDLAEHFPISTSDMEDIIWSYDNTSLIVADTNYEGKVYVYSTNGALKNIIDINSEESNFCELKYFNFSNDGCFLTVGLNNGNIKLYDYLNWNFCCSVSHSNYSKKGVNFFREEEVKLENIVMTKFVQLNEFPIIKTNNNKGTTPRKDIKEIEWNCDSTSFAFSNYLYPNILYIFDCTRMKMSNIIIQIKPIQDFKWSPTNPNFLLIATETKRIYLYSATSISTIEIPGGPFSSCRIKWNSNGREFVLCDKTRKTTICGYLSEDSVNSGDFYRVENK